MVAMGRGRLVAGGGRRGGAGSGVVAGDDRGGEGIEGIRVRVLAAILPLLTQIVPQRVKGWKPFFSYYDLI